MVSKLGVDCMPQVLRLELEEDCGVVWRSTVKYRWESDFGVTEGNVGGVVGAVAGEGGAVVPQQPQLWQHSSPSCVATAAPAVVPQQPQLWYSVSHTAADTPHHSDLAPCTVASY